MPRCSARIEHGQSKPERAGQYGDHGEAQQGTVTDLSAVFRAAKPPRPEPDQFVVVIDTPQWPGERLCGDLPGWVAPGVVERSHDPRGHFVTCGSNSGRSTACLGQANAATWDDSNLGERLPAARSAQRCSPADRRRDWTCALGEIMDTVSNDWWRLRIAGDTNDRFGPQSWRAVHQHDERYTARLAPCFQCAGEQFAGTSRRRDVGVLLSDMGHLHEVPWRKERSSGNRPARSMP
jgi:hypothetical protein